MSFRVESAEEFSAHVVQVVSENQGDRVRCMVKYNHRQPRLTLRATDDVVTLTHKASSGVDFTTIGEMNEQLMAAFCGVTVEELRAQKEARREAASQKKKKPKRRR